MKLSTRGERVEKSPKYGQSAESWQLRSARDDN